MRDFWLGMLVTVVSGIIFLIYGYILGHREAEAVMEGVFDSPGWYALIHAGEFMPDGVPVTRGRRYILLHCHPAALPKPIFGRWVRLASPPPRRKRLDYWDSLYGKRLPKAIPDPNYRPEPLRLAKEGA